jgi:hypothetical protein
MFGDQHRSWNLRVGHLFESAGLQQADGLVEVKLVRFLLHASLSGSQLPSTSISHNLPVRRNSGRSPKWNGIEG